LYSATLRTGMDVNNSQCIFSIEADMKMIFVLTDLLCSFIIGEHKIVTKDDVDRYAHERNTLEKYHVHIDCLTFQPVYKDVFHRITFFTDSLYMKMFYGGSCCFITECVGKDIFNFRLYATESDQTDYTTILSSMLCLILVDLERLGLLIDTVYESLKTHSLVGEMLDRIRQGKNIITDKPVLWVVK